MRMTGLIFLGWIFIISCEDPFSYSLYESSVPSNRRNLTAKNIETIERIPAPNVSFSFAVLADVHYDYDELRSAVEKINNDDKILFVAVIGDLTQNGLLREFLFFDDVMGHLKKPYITVIGNHDYLSNGERIYEQMFGASNYTFQFGNISFVLFDDVFWERNGVPDFAWLASQLSDRDESRIICIAHIPPTDEQFPDQYQSLYQEMMANGNVVLSMHGHSHRYSVDNSDDVIIYGTTAAIKKRSFTVVLVTPAFLDISEVKF